MWACVGTLVCAGTVISGGRVERSIVGPMVRINSFSHITDSILFEGVEVGRYCRIRRAIIDKGGANSPGFEIGYDLEKDRQRGFTISDNGVVTIPKTDFLASDLRSTNDNLRFDAPSSGSGSYRSTGAGLGADKLDRYTA